MTVEFTAQVAANLILTCFLMIIYIGIWLAVLLDEGLDEAFFTYEEKPVKPKKALPVWKVIFIVTHCIVGFVAVLGILLRFLSRRKGL